ncbi:MAG: class IV adenylate cyclase [Pseudomonadota bacterium]
MPNVEIKCTYPDLKRGKTCAERLGARFDSVQHQIDTYFATRSGRLKIREIEGKGAQLIPYLRPDTTGPKVSDYQMIPIPEVRAVKALLDEILGIEVVVEKQRSIYLLQNVRIHLDEVKNLGSFLEFEAVYDRPEEEESERTKVNRLLSEFGVKPDSLLAGSYREMLRSGK